MHFGLMIFPGAHTPSPAELARLTEERGFDSLWFPEHTHIPAGRDTPYPAGGDLPPEYSRLLDPLLALTAAAAASSTIGLGTGVLLPIERDPIVLAKEIATLDLLSDGRLIVGVGAGWNIEEMRNHGTDPGTRFGLMRERVEAMKAIWTQEEASYHGKHVSFERIWSWPKPVQDPHPPVWIAGNGERVLDRVLRYGDGWLPNVVGGDDYMLERIGELRRRADEAGREIPVTLYAAPAKTVRLERYAEAGVEGCIFLLPSAGMDEIEARLDWVQGAIAPLRASTP
jgi:probable F420-dependent oxidoreductase